LGAASLSSRVGFLKIGSNFLYQSRPVFSESLVCQFWFKDAGNFIVGVLKAYVNFAVYFVRFVKFALISHLSTLGWKYGWNQNNQNLKRAYDFS